MESVLLLCNMEGTKRDSEGEQMGSTGLEDLFLMNVPQEHFLSPGSESTEYSVGVALSYNPLCY